MKSTWHRRKLLVENPISIASWKCSEKSTFQHIYGTIDKSTVFFYRLYQQNEISIIWCTTWWTYWHNNSRLNGIYTSNREKLRTHFTWLKGEERQMKKKWIKNPPTKSIANNKQRGTVEPSILHEQEKKINPGLCCAYILIYVTYSLRFYIFYSSLGLYAL